MGGEGGSPPLNCQPWWGGVIHDTQRDLVSPFPSPPVEILYEDLHFVAVFLAFLAAVAALLISLMWVCNKCAYKFQRKRRHKLKGNSLGPVIIHSRIHGWGMPVSLVSPRNPPPPIPGLMGTCLGLSLVLQRAPPRRSSCRMWSVNQGCAQFHSYLRGKVLFFQQKGPTWRNHPPILLLASLDQPFLKALGL